MDSISNTMAYPPFTSKILALEEGFMIHLLRFFIGLLALALIFGWIIFPIGALIISAILVIGASYGIGVGILEMIDSLKR